MNALVYIAPRCVEIQDCAEPLPRPDQCLIKVSGTGICGSDMSGFLGHSTRRKPPLILGHEVVGTVTQLPPGEWPFTVGGRVIANPLQFCGDCEACRNGRQNLCPQFRLLGMDREQGGFADYAAVDARNVFPVPPGISDAQAVAVEPLANGVHLFSQMRQNGLGTLAVFGAGTQGILMLQLARLLGFRDIAVVDTNAARLAIARKLGASLALNPCDQPGPSYPSDAIVQWTNGRGVDAGIDAAGLAATRHGLIRCVRRGGEIMLLGLHDNVSEVDFAAVVRNEQRLQGSFAYTPSDFAASKRLLERGEISIEPWTRALPLEQGQAAFEELTSDPGATLKVILTP